MVDIPEKFLQPVESEAETPEDGTELPAPVVDIEYVAAGVELVYAQMQTLTSRLETMEQTANARTLLLIFCLGGEVTLAALLVLSMVLR